MPKELKYVLYLDDTSKSELTAFSAGTESTLDPGYVSGPIIRDCYIAEYCNSGRGTVTVNNTTFSLQGGQCFMLFPGSIVTLESSVEDPWCFTWVCFYGSKVAYHLENMGITEEDPIFPWQDNQEILDFMLSGIAICHANSPTLEFEQNAFGNTLFAMFARACMINTNSKLTARSPQRYISQALQYIESNFLKRIKVCDIASHIGLNRTYFSTLFHDEMGQTPQEFLIQYRIKKACDFFSNPHATVSSVAYSLGYEPHVFSRVFKQVTGQTPQEYKQSLSTITKD